VIVSTARRLQRGALACLLAVVTLPACDQGEGPGGPPTPDACVHIDNAYGVLLSRAGTQLYRQLLASTQGSIEATSDSTVTDIEVHFLLENGDPIVIPNDCAINALGFQVTDPSMVQIRYDLARRWFFDVVAMRPGSTTIRVLLVHTSHSHFRSETITVNVAP
jgi:hypothetical protein